MKEKIIEILNNNSQKSTIGWAVEEDDFETVAQELVKLIDTTFQRNKNDLLNWAKSELSQEEHEKLTKFMTPYRNDKIIFLRKAIKRISNL